MSRIRAVREYAIIVLVTVLVLETCAFGALVWRTMRAKDVSLWAAVAERVAQHPWLDVRVPRPERSSEYVFLPTTQYAFRPHARFSGLEIGAHGFILNGDEEPRDFPGKPADLTRIVLLGGSSAAGATASDNDRTIAAQLEALLATQSGARRFQVLNFGMGGNYSYGELTRLVAEVAYLEPDAVVMLDGFNDAHYANFEHLRSHLEAPLMNWADLSYHYFDAMSGLRHEVRPPPPVLTYSFLLVRVMLGSDLASVREQRAAAYGLLPATLLSAWVRESDPRFLGVLRTNLDFAAAWAARRGVALLAYLQPHPWQHKDLACERAAGTRLVIGRLGRSVDEASYAATMRAAFDGYGEVYATLESAYADAAGVRFLDLRTLFAGVEGCIYNDPIHYNDRGNALIAARMREDLVAVGVVGRP